MPDWLARHRLEAGLTLRMSAAGLITFAIGHAFGLAQVFWAVLTAIVVMQSSIGGSLKATVDRIVGTIGGAFWGAASSWRSRTAMRTRWGSPLPSRSCRWRQWRRFGRAFASRR